MNNKDLTARKEEQGLISAGDLADLAGVSLQSVLNYVKKGDLIPANEAASGRMFFRKEQIITVSFLKKGRSTKYNNILCLCFSG
jgi:DNA-binding transcriptional MerR regulator